MEQTSSIYFEVLHIKYFAPARATHIKAISITSHRRVVYSPMFHKHMAAASVIKYFSTDSSTLAEDLRQLLLQQVSNDHDHEASKRRSISQFLLFVPTWNRQTNNRWTGEKARRQWSLWRQQDGV